MSTLWHRDAAVEATASFDPPCRAIGGDWSATGISIDSRDINPGDLFIALVGPTHDGHDHVVQALAKGAAAALVHKIPEGLPAGAKLLVVPDTLDGLRALAVASRKRSKARIAAITGSVGKTGTKEMLKLALSAAGSTHASAGSLNNHWGVPLSLARMPEDTAFGVFELGMNHKGEIGPLSKLAQPHVAIITTIEVAHLEFFESTAEIAVAKAEIFEGLVSGGTAILPQDNRHFALLADAAKAANVPTILGFGSHIDSAARLLHAQVRGTGTDVLALLGEQNLSFHLGIAGRHWAMNSLAVLLVARALGVPVETSTKALAGMAAPKGRGQRLNLPWPGGSIEVIDESYNANPASMKAAIALLAASSPAAGGRKIAVLGDMLELGATSPALHAELASAVAANGIDQTFTAGSLMRSLHDALPANLRGAHAADSASIAAIVKSSVIAGDVVMVKGSAGSKMGRVIDALAATPANAMPTHIGARPRANCA